MANCSTTVISHQARGTGIHIPGIWQPCATCGTSVISHQARGTGIHIPGISYDNMCNMWYLNLRCMKTITIKTTTELHMVTYDQDHWQFSSSKPCKSWASHLIFKGDAPRCYTQAGEQNYVCFDGTRYKNIVLWTKFTIHHMVKRRNI